MESEFVSYLKPCQHRVDTREKHDREVQCLLGDLGQPDTPSITPPGGMSAGSVFADPKAESLIGHPELVLTAISKLLSSLSSGLRANLTTRSRPRQRTLLPSTEDLLATTHAPQDHISPFPS